VRGEASSASGKRKGGLTERAADVVQHDVGTVFAEHRPGLLGPVRQSGVDQRIGPELGHPLQLRAAGDSGHPCPAGTGEPHAQHSQTAAGPDHEHPVPRPDLRRIEQGQGGRPVMQQSRGHRGAVTPTTSPTTAL
jgi:hypothetical protein